MSSLAFPAAAFSSRVTLQRATETQTALGVVLSWSTVSTVWGALIPLDFRLMPAYQQMYPQATHRLVLRGKVEVEVARTRFLIQNRIYVPAGVEFSPEGGRAEGYTVVAVVRRPEEED